MKIARIFSGIAVCACVALASCEKPVTGGTETPGPEDKPSENEGQQKELVLSFNDSDDDRSDIPMAFFENDEAGRTLNVCLDDKAVSDVEAEIFFDEAYADQFNIKNGTDYSLFPAGKVSLPESGKVTIASGQSEVEISLSFDAAGDDVRYNTPYLLPLSVRVLSENVSVDKKAVRVNYIVTKKRDKTIKNCCYFEINDVNPLNALEYVCEDGTYFFDAVVLFAGNIAWNEETQRVQFSHPKEPNMNIATLLEESETYLQPLRDAGMKVYLGLLPHHTYASLTRLSKWGCEEFAKEIAQLVYDHKIDGVALDEEYAAATRPEGEQADKWFGEPAGGSYMAFQLEKQMADKCPWPTGVTVYMWGMYDDVEYEGKTYTSKDYIEFSVADYGGRTTPETTGLDMSSCSAMSIELNRAIGDVDEASARQWKEEGYGWCMWFAFNPVPSHDLYNLQGSMKKFRAASKGFYDSELPDPTGYYKKMGEGVYDPERYGF